MKPQILDLGLLIICSMAYGFNNFLYHKLIPTKFEYENDTDSGLNVAFKVGAGVPSLVLHAVAIWAFFEIKWWLVVAGYIAGQVVGGFCGGTMTGKLMTGRLGDIDANKVRNIMWLVSWVSIILGGILSYRFLIE